MATSKSYSLHLTQVYLIINLYAISEQNYTLGNFKFFLMPIVYNSNNHFLAEVFTAVNALDNWR